ncbi:hypothetical protein F4780DRAFT_720783 [Xylariomycetidae sp. FL0641]|nr:hypothetical protein F4780DRAFT_720783 [Xylariomycetidae sp. FL0641]
MDDHTSTTASSSTATSLSPLPIASTSNSTSISTSVSPPTFLTEAGLSINQQVDSRLCKLPQEVRDKIYRGVFESTVLTYGPMPEDSETRRLPHPNDLALLRTCRRIRFEIGSTWLGQVLFNFKAPDIMISVLALQPLQVRNLVRHVRVTGHAVTWYLPTPDDHESLRSVFSDAVVVRTKHKLGGHELRLTNVMEVHVSIAAAMKCLPGLRLDMLTVLKSRERLIWDFHHWQALQTASMGSRKLCLISRAEQVSLCISRISRAIRSNPEGDSKNWLKDIHHRLFTKFTLNREGGVYCDPLPRVFDAIDIIEKNNHRLPTLPRDESIIDSALAEIPLYRSVWEEDKLSLVTQQGNEADYEVPEPSPSYARFFEANREWILNVGSRVCLARKHKAYINTGGTSMAHYFQEPEAVRQ